LPAHRWSDKVWVQNARTLAIIYGKTSQRIGFLIAIGLGLFIALFRVEIISLFNTGPPNPLIRFHDHVVIIRHHALSNCPSHYDRLFARSRRCQICRIHFTAQRYDRPSAVLTYLFAYPLGLGLTGAWLSVLLDQSLRYVISKRRFAQASWTRIEV
jgi:hypothetical protein